VQYRQKKVSAKKGKIPDHVGCRGMPVLGFESGIMLASAEMGIEEMPKMSLG
jgi:hypothetical protein